MLGHGLRPVVRWQEAHRELVLQPAGHLESHPFSSSFRSYYKREWVLRKRWATLFLRFGPNGVCSFNHHILTHHSAASPLSYFEAFQFLADVRGFEPHRESQTTPRHLAVSHTCNPRKTTSYKETVLQDLDLDVCPVLPSSRSQTPTLSLCFLLPIVALSGGEKVTLYS